MKTDDKVYLTIYGAFVLSMIIMLGMILFAVETQEESSCECIEWLNESQDIKCIVRKDERKPYQSGDR